MNRSGIALTAVVVLAFLPVCARAQTASITGTVKDATGAVVPQTRITAQNVPTNAPRTVVTDDSGIYRITNLAPGTHDVLIEKPGFKSVEFSQITLAVDHVQNLDATLTVSTVEARVKVTGESVAPLDLNNAQIGNMVTSQQISSLPLVLRDPYQLALLSPGVNQSNSILGGLSVNGSGERNNNFLLDGTDNNDTDIPDSFTTVGSSIYNALQMNITNRLSHGLFLQAAYTWGHEIDNSSDPLVPTAGGETFPRNSFNLAAEGGNSDFDVRQRLVLNYTWEIPLGSGHQHFSEGAMGKILEGWQVAGITTFASGLPFDIFTSVDSAHTGFAQRPDYNPSATLFPVADPRTQTGPNLGLFSNPPFGAGGNLMRNKFFGPGINNWDTVLQKTTRIFERMSVQFRAEVYNLFNRVQFNQPGNLTSDPGTFGQSTDEVTRPDGTSGARQVQFGLKFQF